MARKLYATVNGAEKPVVLSRTGPRSPWLPVADLAVDVRAAGPGRYAVLLDGKSIEASLIKEDRENGTLKLRIAGRTYLVSLQDDRAHLVQELGLEDRSAQLAPDVKAPMPGLVMSILVKAGDAVQKNDPLLVLEAMKMENVIKAPAPATIAAVHTRTGTAVEKGELLLTFAYEP